MGQRDKMQQVQKLLEVIACSTEDAIESESGGANRVELVRALGKGGFTPDLMIVRAIVALRENPGAGDGQRERRANRIQR